jgi:hypothetical protein
MNYWVRYHVRYGIAVVLLGLLVYWNFVATPSALADAYALLSWWTTIPYLLLMRYADNLEIRLSKSKAEEAVRNAIASASAVSGKEKS